MKKLTITHPKFGWFDGTYELLMSQFHPNESDPINEGVSVVIDFKNNTGKTIKYAIFIFDGYNAVGDLAVEANGQSYTGPVLPGKINRNLILHNLWFSRQISLVRFGCCNLIYMDGTEELLYEDDVELVSKI